MKPATLRQLIDRAGELKAQESDIKSELESIKVRLIKAGIEQGEGELFRVTISKSQRHVLDMEAVRAHVSPQFITANTVLTISTAMRVTARTGEEA